MKKLFIISFSLATIFMLTGCNDNVTGSTSANTNSATTVVSGTVSSS